ncbi:DUF418 domain-containing protein [Altererythrobacter salegens]|uniref:DUF418 domain-containing protein n=1 Tax=Croceibacterium salegens TaxID=1737568 RepID=A0A6I4T032_9SPHN|nr:DUF418 domain-containing protein [Croceibacterium salegens]MXO60979.1 DUF418 domain-containing protein [Croceibacterium salegens]
MATVVSGQPDELRADATPDQPVRAGERLVTLDLIRGVAVLGILFANITAFGHPDAAYFWPKALPGGATLGDKVIWYVQLIFVDHKCRGLFSLLFGAGIYLFMERAWARGSSRWLQFRRLCWLLAFGAVHYFLIWHGDILGTYAATGLMVLPMLKWSASKQLKTGIVLYSLGMLGMLTMLGGAWLAANNPSIAAHLSDSQREEVVSAEPKTLESVAKNIEFMQSASYPEFVTEQVTKHAGGFLQSLVVVPLMETLGLVLIGMALYRRGFFSGAIDPAKLRRGGWIALLGGLGFTALVALWPEATGFPFFTTLLTFNELGRLAQLPIALGLAAILAADGPRLAQTPIGNRFAAAGRMAFSNYLGTSILMLFVFQGWSLGLFGELHRVQLMLIVFAVWTGMLLWSKPWLAHFRYGPLEWLWRCLTYWKLFPFRR